MTVVVLAIFVLALGVGNGANDVSKGVATLVGSDVTSYRRALAWGTAWTVVGSIAAAAVSVGLVGTFSTALLLNPPHDTASFALAVAVGACGWIILATQTGLPVSTTHAMTGAIVGVALARAGVAGVRWSLLASSVAVPLALSPLLAGLLSYLLHAASVRHLLRAASYCVCVESLAMDAVPALAGQAARVETIEAPALVVGRAAGCERPAVRARVAVTDAAHWIAGAALSFARGLNDNPKIVALGVATSAAAGWNSAWIFVAGAMAIGLGSWSFGRRVTTTLAERVTALDPLEGLSASAVAAVLVLLASWVALPVSTTHVVAGAIGGAGLRRGTAAIRWRTVAHMVAAWVVTLPVASLLGALAWALLG